MNWGKRYRLNLRQDDIQWGKNEGIIEGINKRSSEEQAKEFLRRLEEFHKSDKYWVLLSFFYAGRGLQPRP
ncbi:MAG: hypothetical protein ABFS56_26500 [Pseudomonadota bacterium]